MKIFQPIVTGSLSVSGSVYLTSLTSVAQSHVLTVDTTTGELYYTASSAIGGGGGVSGDYVTTASFNAYTGSNVSQFAGTASYATTAGTAINAVNAQSGSNFVVTTTLVIDETLTDFAKVNSTIVGSNNLFQQATGSWTSAHGRYTLYKGANARAGEFRTVWNGTSTTYTDVSTTDVGSTADLSFISAIVTSQLQLNAVAASSGWTVKMLVTYV